MRCRGTSLISNSDLSFSFDLVTRFSSLTKQYYSLYQHFLSDTISDKLNKGMNYKEIADWLNNNGYSTTRGKRFRNAHTHSIVHKKKLSDQKQNRLYPSSLTNRSLEVTDRRLVNSIWGGPKPLIRLQYPYLKLFLYFRDFQGIRLSK